jgi:hypothetical protein
MWSAYLAAVADKCRVETGCVVCSGRSVRDDCAVKTSQVREGCHMGILILELKER